jgi:hypothetical protein
MSVLKIAALMPRSPAHQELFACRLPLIFKAVKELRTAIGENFTSADLNISVFDCDTKYDPSLMYDAHDDGVQPSTRALGAIVGTTGIGLKKLIVECDSDGAPQFQNVISAKVVLRSTLKRALEPEQSSGRSSRRKKKSDNIHGANQDGRG